jgi:hypothetical protein
MNRWAYLPENAQLSNLCANPPVYRWHYQNRNENTVLTYTWVNDIITTTNETMLTFSSNTYIIKHDIKTNES